MGIDIDLEHAAHPLFHIGPLEVTAEITTAWGIMLLILILAWVVTRRLERIPGRTQNIVELLVEGIVDFVLEPVMHSRAQAYKYLPFLGSLFVFILVSNYSGLLPGAGLLPGFKPPTSSLSITGGLAIVAFLGTQYAGFQAHGLKYLKHFIQPYPFFLPLNLIEVIVRPVSLALRLYGNIFGEETVILVLLLLVPMLVPLPMMILSLLFGVLQAYIFTTLTAVYIAEAVGEEH